MKLFLLYFLYFQLISFSISIIPIWNFENSAINLFSSSTEDSFVVCEREMYDLNLKLERKLEKDGEQKNIIYFFNVEKGDVPWEDIESFYKINSTEFICPKGKYHMHIYNNDIQEFQEVIPDSFSEDEDWDLQCYYQKDQSYMFVAYINKHPKMYSLKINTWAWKEIEFNEGLYDFKWVTDPVNNEYPMKAIVLKDNMITLKGRTFQINGNENKIEFYDKQEKQFIKILSHSNSYYNLYNNNFYFMTYDSTDNFVSGFYNETETIDYDNIENIEPIISNSSPLEFFNEVEIIYLKFIKNTKYTYYKIKDNTKNVIYHGIIDLLLNKVIFNTDEEINEFKPYSNNSMLAITNNSAYKICAIQQNGICIDECSNSFSIFDTSKPNQCGQEINCDIILIPNEICIESCDENIFTKIGKKCGLCRDMDSEKKYKLLNSTGCVDENEANTIVVNEKLKFLSCKENYTLNNGRCVPICYELCETCEEYSDNINDQKCTSCSNDYLLKGGNCVTDCNDGYFVKEKKCEECPEFCKNCENSDKCNICYDGYYLEENECKKCSDNCETCSKGPEENGNNNCITCDQNTLNKYLINDDNYHSCVEECPDNTFLYDSKCEKCSEFCKICENSDKCNICYDGYYLEENECKKCSDNCETCSKGPEENGNNNCITCDQNTLNKYLIDDINKHICVENCPKDTILIELNLTCIIKNKSNNSESNKTYIIWIIIILIIILLIIIIIYICKKYSKRVTSKEIEQINDIESKQIIK